MGALLGETRTLVPLGFLISPVFHLPAELDDGQGQPNRTFSDPHDDKQKP
jgi:hypothetical protein